MSIWYNPDPSYDCLFIMWPGRDRWHGVTEFPGMTCTVKMKKRWRPQKSDWVYIGEF